MKEKNAIRTSKKVASMASKTLRSSKRKAVKSLAGIGLVNRKKRG